jgi:hypothetical protein
VIKGWQGLVGQRRDPGFGTRNSAKHCCLHNFIHITATAVLLCVAPALPQQTETDNFEVNGMVINAATGEPVSRALVQMQAATGKAQFTGADGTLCSRISSRCSTRCDVVELGLLVLDGSATTWLAQLSLEMYFAKW